MLHIKKQRALGQKLARPGVMLAVMLTLYFGLGARPDASAGQEGVPQTLSGTWKADVTLTNCATGAALPIPHNPFPALNTFLTNGTVLEVGSRSPYRSPGHGTWERDAHNEFLSRIIWFRFAADGTYIGTQEVAQAIRLVSPDEYAATSTTVLRDAGGNPVGSGCARATGVRY